MWAASVPVLCVAYAPCSVHNHRREKVDCSQSREELKSQGVCVWGRVGGGVGVGDENDKGN